MNRDSLVVFNDYIVATGTSAVAFSSSNFDSRLAIFDQLSLTVSVEQLVGGSNPMVRVDLLHSADGMNFSTKPAAPEIPPTGIMAGVTNVLIGFDDGTTPSLRYLRCKITLTTTTAGIKARVKVTATLNDSREGLFAAKMRRALAHGHNLDGCKTLVQGGTKNLNFPPEVVRALHLLHEASKHSSSDRAAADRVGDFFHDIEDNYFALNTDASICVRYDGTVILSAPGKAPIAISSPTNSHGNGVHHGNSGGGAC